MDKKKQWVKGKNWNPAIFEKKKLGKNMAAIFAFRQSLRTKRWENIWRIAPYIAITFETNAHLFNGTLDRFLIVAMICWDKRFNYETAVISSNLRI